MLQDHDRKFPPRPMSHAFPGDGIQLRLLDWGEGSPQALLLLHGLTSFAQTWDPFARQVCDEFRVVAPDLRGHGQSQHASDGYAPERFIDDVLHLVRFLNLTSFDLVGHSLGALVALGFATQHPRRVRRLVLEEGGPGLDLAAAGAASAYLFARPLGFASREEARAWFREHSPHESDDRLDRRAEHGLRQNWAEKWVPRHDPELYWLLAGDDARHEERWGTVASLPCPLLVVRGAQSTLFPFEAARRLAASAPRGTLVEISGAGHSPHAEAPDAFRDAVLRFLRAV